MATYIDKTKSDTGKPDPDSVFNLDAYRKEKSKVKELKLVRSGHAAKLTHLINQASEIMSADSPRDVLHKHFQAIEAAVKSLGNAHTSFIGSLTTKQALEEAQMWFDERTDIASKVMMDISEYVAQTDKNTSIPSKSSKTKSRAKSELLMRKAESAKLKVLLAKEKAEVDKKIAAMKAKHEVEMAELEARLLQEMVEISDLRSEVDSDRTDSVLKQERIHEWVEGQNRNMKQHERSPAAVNNDIPVFKPNVDKIPNMSADRKIPVKHDNPAIDAWIDLLIPGQETHISSHSISGNESGLSDMFIKIESQRDLPKVDLPKFDGSPLRWPRFVEQFHTQIHTRPGINDSRRMDILQSHLEGKAKDIVEGLGYSGRNYAHALQELKSTFGHKVKVARAFLSNVTSGSQLPSGDPDSLQKLYTSLRDCVITFHQFNYESELYSTETVMKVIERLPNDKRGKWNDRVTSIMRKGEPNLTDLLDWLKTQVEAEFNPYAAVPTFGGRYGNRPQTRYLPRDQPVKTHEKKGKSFATTQNTKSNEPKSSKPAKVSQSTSTSSQTQSQANSYAGVKRPCPVCNGPHYLYRCPLFANKTLHERMSTVNSNKLCHNCLKPNHSTPDCFCTLACRVEGCHQRHHTLLHPEQQSTPRGISRKLRSEESVFFQIVPVIASGKNGRRISTFAFLDSGSDITLVSEDLAHDLGLKGKEETLHMSTLNGTTSVKSQKVSFDVTGMDNYCSALHVKAWTTQGTFDCPEQKIDPSWQHIQHLDVRDVEPTQVKLLIGLDIPRAHVQQEVIHGEDHQPIAVRTPVGWSLMGISTAQQDRSDDIQARVNFVISQEKQMNEQIQKFWSLESLGIKYNAQKSTSVEDKRAMQILDNGTHMVNGHYQVPMLWKDNDVKLPNNFSYATKRLNALSRKLNHDETFRDNYSTTLMGYVENNYARKLSPNELSIPNDRTWYLPHHGVRSENKPGKVRVVYDAAASYGGTSLNDNLMPGPDLVNSLFGVLQRFRLYEIALVADIEAMYHQVLVPEVDTDALRFLWNTNSDSAQAPEVYKMTSHIFGATDSSACANYAVKRCATDNSDSFSPLVVQTALNDFYVDDLLKSVESTNQAIQLSRDLSKLLQMGGFHLHKWVSSSSEVLSSIPESERAVTSKNLDLDKLPIQRALGLRWRVGEDCFIFDQNHRTDATTKRGMVSVVSTVFDPCGYLAPYILKAKLIIQELWIRNLDWDEQVPEDILSHWNSWTKGLADLNVFKLQRHHTDFSSDATNVKIHIFADASEKAYGTVAYLVYVTVKKETKCSFLASKTHIAPVKPMSIPRLELQAAVLAVRLGKTLQSEFHCVNITNIVYWTDSTTVLQYINNKTRRFKPFVANRISEILELSSAEQWHHVSTCENPADFCSRGLPANKLTSDHPWFSGPSFLLKDTWNSDQGQTVSAVPEGDPEIKAKHIMKTSVQSTNLNQTQAVLFNPGKFSKWTKLVRVTAWVFRALRHFRSKLKNGEDKPVNSGALSVKECEEAKLYWLHQIQLCEFHEEISELRDGGEVSHKSRLQSLSPFMENGLLRVGGRLRKANIPVEAKHQIVLPDSNPVTDLILDDIHRQIAHGGVEHIVSVARQNYWPLNARRLAKRAVRNCIECHKRRCKPDPPKMADLPVCRIGDFQVPFTHTGVDYFGPILVKSRRSTVKRWGCLFTCLNTRAVHLELAESLETDDFILVLRNFIARRGRPKHMYSDNGTNFHGANNELIRCLNNLNQDRLNDFHSVQHIQWHFNPPSSPHFGGAWERLVRSIKKTLNAVLKDRCVQESVLRTSLYEAEAVVNSRPITYNSTDPNDYTALTPNHFLMGGAISEFTMDKFTNKDIGSRKRWRQSQVIADHLANRWKKEYLPNLTVRQKWRSEGSNVNVGDLVILMDNQKPRSQWDLARITHVYPGDDGRARTVKVITPKAEYVRPAVKVCLLEEAV